MKGLVALRLKLSDFLARDDGASAIEYAIIAGLISVAIIIAATTLGTDISAVFTKISEELQKVAPGAGD